MSSLHFRLAGPDAAELAAELADQLDSLFGERPTQPQGAKAAGTRAAESFDPVAVATLVLAIPAAIVSAMDLAERIRLTEKVDRLIAWARRRLSSGEREIWVVLPSGRVLELDKATAADLIGSPEDSA